MASDKERTNVLKSFKMLKGNTRISVIMEPMYGIPFALFNFYLSLYMKSQGITDLQIGYLIALNFIFSAIFSLVGGVITDHLGRKRTTLIFDLLSWPVALAIYAFSNTFWLFALAIILNSLGKITSVSWSLMVIEDSDNDERIAAFNILNIINLAAGIVTPIGGIIVSAIGVASAEICFLIFMTISMFIMILIRNHFYVETKTGREILDSKIPFNIRDIFKNGLYGRAILAIFKSREMIMIVCVYVLFMVYIPIGTFSSLYYAPYINEVLGIGKSAISILGAVNSVMMLVVFVLIIPIISRFNMVLNMIVGIIIQAVALVFFILIPSNHLTSTTFCVALFALGFGLFRPFIDAILAEVTDGRERAGIYSLLNTIISVFSSLLGLFSGYLYAINPRLIYLESIGILLLSTIFLFLFLNMKKMQ